MRLRHHLLGALAAVATAALLVAPALADGSALGGSGALVRGGAALPRFSPSFPIDIGPAPSTITHDNLEISLTSPDHSVLRFLFSPRVVSGETFGYGSTVTGNYAGLAWNIFENDRLFGNIALTGSVNRQALDDPSRRLYGPLMSLHSTFELGYSLSAQQSLSLSLDHASPAPYFGNDLRLRYGLRF